MKTSFQATARASAFLGHTIQKSGALTIAKKSTERFKGKVRAITKRSRGVSLEQVVSELTLVMRGWLTYFRNAQDKILMRNLDSRIRRKLRCFRIKQCKRVITLQRFLEKHGVDSWQSWILALSGKDTGVNPDVRKCICKLFQGVTEIPGV